MSDLDKAIRAVLEAMNTDAHGRDCGCPSWPTGCVNDLHTQAVRERWLEDVTFALETAVGLGWQPPTMPPVSSQDTPPAPRPEPRVWRDRRGQLWDEDTESGLLYQTASTGRRKAERSHEQVERVYGPLTEVPVSTDPGGRDR